MGNTSRLVIIAGAVTMTDRDVPVMAIDTAIMRMMSNMGPENVADFDMLSVPGKSDVSVEAASQNEDGNHQPREAMVSPDPHCSSET
jgi:hypothetical protein